MTIKFEAMKKYLVAGLAAVCMVISFSNSSEAASRHEEQFHHNRHKVEVHTKDRNMDNAIFYRHKLPSGHKQCTNPYHSKMSPHFHCSTPFHHHKEGKNICRYDHCHEKHPFR